MRHSYQDLQSVVIRRLRFPLIVLIVYLHSYGLPPEDVSVPLVQSGLYEIVRTILSDIIAHSAVPAFFFISGFLFFYNVENFSFQVYKTKMKRRFFTLLIPYLLWNLLALAIWFFRQSRMGFTVEDVLLQYLDKGLLSCFWIFGVVGDENRDVLGNVTHLTIPANLPLWYLRDLIVVSAFSPIIYTCLKRGRLFILSFFAAIFLFGFFQNIPGLSSVAVFFFSFGAYFSITKADYTRIFHQAFVPALMIYLLLLAYTVIRYQTTDAVLLFPLLRMLGVLVVFGIGDWIVRHSVPSLPLFFSESSFFVYAVHYVFFLSFVDHLLGCVFPTTNEITHTMLYLICPMIKVFLYVGIYAVLKRCVPRPLSIMVGKR